MLDTLKYTVDNLQISKQWCAQTLVIFTKQLSFRYRKNGFISCFRIVLETVLSCFFSIRVFFHEHSQLTGQQGKEEVISLSPLYHYWTLHRHLTLARLLLQRAHFSTYLAAGLEMSLRCFFKMSNQHIFQTLFKFAKKLSFRHLCKKWRNLCKMSWCLDKAVARHLADVFWSIGVRIMVFRLKRPKSRPIFIF